MNSISELFTADLSDLITSMDRGAFAWVALCLLTVGLLTYSFYEARISQQKWARAQEFARSIQTLERYRSVLDNGDNSKGSEISNPLSYLEGKVNRKNLGELSPIGQNDNSQFRLSLEGVSPDKIFKLLKDLEKQSQITVAEFSLERINIDGRKYDARFEINFTTVNRN